MSRCGKPVPGTRSSRFHILFGRAWQSAPALRHPARRGPPRWRSGLVEWRASASPGGGRLPQPVTDLIVEGGVFAHGQYVCVIAQAIEKLRTVQLIVDGLKIDPFDEFFPLRPHRLRVQVHALAAFPYARQAAIP